MYSHAVLLQMGLHLPILIGISCMGIGWIVRRKLRRACPRAQPVLRAHVVHPGGSLRPRDKDEIGIASFNILADQVCLLCTEMSTAL